LVLDEGREHLYVLTRFQNSIVAVDTETRAVVQTIAMMNPEPASIVAGRPFLYDAKNPNPCPPDVVGVCNMLDFDPLKGPMTTQSLRGLENAGPVHWRGDRTGDSTGGDTYRVAPWPH
jgi:hypothetical protein